MAVINFPLMKKPIEQRIVDAACIYWDLEPDFFYYKGDPTERMRKGRTKNSSSALAYKKSIVYYLLKQKTPYSYPELAKMFNYIGHQPVIRAVDTINCQQSIYKQIKNDLHEIEAIADNLAACFDVVSINVFLSNMQA